MKICEVHGSRSTFRCCFAEPVPFNPKRGLEPSAMQIWCRVIKMYDPKLRRPPLLNAATVPSECRMTILSHTTSSSSTLSYKLDQKTHSWVYSSPLKGCGCANFHDFSRTANPSKNAICLIFCRILILIQAACHVEQTIEIHSGQRLGY